MAVRPPRPGEPVRGPFLQEVWRRLNRQRIRTAPPLYHTETDGGTLIGIREASGVVPAVAPAGGIAALSGTTPGVAVCAFNQWDGANYTADGRPVVVRNRLPLAVPGGALLLIHRWAGAWWVAGWYCSPYS